MKQTYLVPLGNLFTNASGVIEKNLWYCIDAVTCFMLQDRTYRSREDVCMLFHLYLDMLIENDDEEDSLDLEDIKTREVFDFVWSLYQRVYPYLAPILHSMDGYVYTVEHYQIINNNLYVLLDLDGEEDVPCSLANLPPLNSFI